MASKARVAVTLVFFAHGALFGTWVARIPAIQNDRGLGEGELGIALFGATLGGLAGLVVAGWVVPRKGSRATVARGEPLFALLLPLLALAPNLALLVAALFAFGLMAGAVDVAMNAHGLAVERRRGRPILSSFHAGWSFGGLGGAVAGALAAKADVDPLVHFASAALVLGSAAILASRWLLPTEADRSEAPARLGRPPRRLAALGVLAFCGLFAEGAAADWSAVYLAGSLAAGAGVAALGFAAFSVSMASVRLVGDRLTTRWGPVALTRRGGLLAGGGLALALLVGQPAVALVGFACMGAGLAAIVPIAFRAAGSLPGVPAGVGIAALTTIGYGAFLVGPPLIGLTAELIGLPRALGIVVLLLGGLVLLARSTQPSRENAFDDAARAAPAPLPLR
jgi:MFS transporter